MRLEKMDIFVFIFGLFMGSFLNVLADRLPTGRDVLWGRSVCESCKKSLRWFELLPILSYLLQAGKCRRCHVRLSLQYPVAELCTGIGYVLLYRYFGSPLSVFFPLLIIFSAFFVMTVSDIKYQILPDSMVVVSLIGVIVLHMYGITLSHWVPYVMSGIVSLLFFYGLWYFTKGRGMGFGDVKLSLVIGLFLGFPLTIIAFYIAFLTGALLGVILILKGSKTLKSKIAFGPFMILGSSVAFVFSTYFLHLWKTFF